MYNMYTYVYTCKCCVYIYIGVNVMYTHAYMHKYMSPSYISLCYPDFIDDYINHFN